jgi:hypothetical protein
MNAQVLAVVGVFFIVGLAAGVIAVVALGVLRADRQRRGGPPAQGPGGPFRPAVA